MRIQRKTKKNILFGLAVFFAFSLVLNFHFFPSKVYQPLVEILNFKLANAAAPQELQDSIKQKAKELQEVGNKIKETQKNLDETQGQRKSLQSEVLKINTNINQVALSIKSSEILLDKLGLEIDFLQYDISDIEKSIEAKREALSATIQEIQERDRETALIVFLKNQTLTDGVFEMQSLLDLNLGLKTQINELKGARDELSDKLDDRASKKQTTESEHENLTSKKIILGDLKNDKQVLLTQTKNQEKIYQKTLSELEKKQTEIARQIEEMERQLRQTINPDTLPGKAHGVLAMPVINAPLTQEYGATEFAKYGYKGKWHNGLDFGAPIGAPIYSSEAGEVIAVGNQDKYCYRGAYGKFIVISHNNNLTTLYGHLSLQTVSEGDKITRGQIIGYVGKTGYATGPHLHFTVYASPTVKISPSKTCGPKMPYGGDLNPLDYLPPL